MKSKTLTRKRYRTGERWVDLFVAILGDVGHKKNKELWARRAPFRLITAGLTNTMRITFSKAKQCCQVTGFRLYLDGKLWGEKKGFEVRETYRIRCGDEICFEPGSLNITF